ncbi:MAG: nitroreductase family protein [Pseudomonas fluorescens]|nr:nitroreductase family protein [Pseudomonas fluorescens]
MQALDALLNRVSVPRLIDPAPTAEQREVLFGAAMRAPDHGHLQAAHGILLAAYAQGIGAVWRTGDLAYSPHVAKGLGLAEGEEVIAFLYLGTPQKEPRVAEKVDLAEFVSAWPGKA